MRSADNQEIRDLRSETLALKKEKEAAHEQIKALQVQFEREAHNHAETRERLHEAEVRYDGNSCLKHQLDEPLHV
jgi:hypothetical protein